MGSKKRKHKPAQHRSPASPKSRQPGKDYRSPKYIQYIFRAEAGIHEGAVMDPNLSDADVLQTLRTMIQRLQAGQQFTYEEESEGSDNLIAWRITQNWAQLPPLPSYDLAGCLNEVLKSAQTRSEMHGGRRGYLGYLAGFMRQAGVEVQEISSADLQTAGGFVEEVDFEAMSLTEIGELWLKEPELWDVDVAFENRADEMSRQGRGQEVITLCRRLVKQTADPGIRADLYHIAGKAYHQMGDYQQAVAMQQTVVAEDPGYAAAFDALALAYRAMNQPRKAIEAWEQELEAVTENVHAYQDIAETYRQMGDLAAEEATWRRRIQFRQARVGLIGQLLGRGQDSEALAHLADCLRRQGREKEAQAIEGRIRRTMPENA